MLKIDKNIDFMRKKKLTLFDLWFNFDIRIMVKLIISQGNHPESE